MTDLNIWSFLVGMVAMPLGWLLLTVAAIVAHRALKEWARVVTAIVHRGSNANQRNLVAGILNSAKWATFFGGDRYGVIFFRGYDGADAKSAADALDAHGPHPTVYKIKPAVNPKYLKPDGGDPA